MVPPMKDPKVFTQASIQFSNTPDALLPVTRCDGDEATAVADVLLQIIFKSTVYGLYWQSKAACERIISC